MHFPSLFDSSKMTTAKNNIKKNILAKMIRFLHGETARTRDVLIRSTEKVIQTYDYPVLVRILSAQERAYKRSKEHHRRRLEKKLTHLIGKVDTGSKQVPAPTSEERVTDLTNSLSGPERTLLEKGPKFAEWHTS